MAYAGDMRIKLRDQRNDEVVVRIADDGKIIIVEFSSAKAPFPVISVWSPALARDLIKAIETTAREAEKRASTFRDMDGNKSIVKVGTARVNSALVPGVCIFHEYDDDDRGDRVFSAAEARRLARALDKAANEVEEGRA